MKIVLRPPCRECPFLKKSLAGWLGQETPEQVWSRVHGDDEFGYPCHMDADVVAERDRDDESWRVDPDSVEQCVGALIHAKKTAKNYADKFRQAARDVLAAVLGVEAVMGIEFLKHHKRGIR